MEKAKLAGSNRPPWRGWLLSLSPYIGIVLVLLVLPSFLSPYLVTMVTKVLIFAIFAMSLDLILGYTGLLSLGHAAYLGIAGYTAGILMVHFGFDSLWVVMPLGVLSAGIFAAIIGDG